MTVFRCKPMQLSLYVLNACWNTAALCKWKKTPYLDVFRDVFSSLLCIAQLWRFSLLLQTIFNSLIVFCLGWSGLNIFPMQTRCVIYKSRGFPDCAPIPITHNKYKHCPVIRSRLWRCQCEKNTWNELKQCRLWPIWSSNRMSQGDVCGTLFTSLAEGDNWTEWWRIRIFSSDTSQKPLCAFG